MKLFITINLLFIAGGILGYFQGVNNYYFWLVYSLIWGLLDGYLISHTKGNKWYWYVIALLIVCISFGVLVLI